MQQVTLKNEEVQTLRLALGGVPYIFRFYPFRSLMYVDITKVKNVIVAGKRVMVGEWLVPPYMSNEDGNVRFEAWAPDRESYVWYEGFNTKFRFMVYGADELEE